MKNMKNFTDNLSAKAIVLFAILAAACSSPGGFSRGDAASGISADNSYKTLSTMSIDASRISNAGAPIWQLSAEDTAEQALVRAREDFKARQPQLLAAEHLGFIKLYIEDVKLGPTQIDMPSELFNKKLGVWSFKVRSEITDAGRELWTDAGLQVNELALPLAVRDAPQITGIADENPTMKRVDFTYNWKPNELSASLDPTNPAFIKLPGDIQNLLKNPRLDIFANNKKTIDISGTRAGRAYFKKFDDGWRLNNLSLF